MAEQQRNVPIAAEISLLRKAGTDKGNAQSWYALIGRFNADDATFRDLMRWAFSWTPDIYRLKHAYLDLYGTAAGPASASNFGATPRVKVRALTADFVAYGGQATGLTYSDWKATAATVYGGPGVSGATADSGVIASPSDRVRIDVIELVEAIAPATVKKRDGTPCDGGVHRGWRVFSHGDEGDQAFRWAYRAFVPDKTRNPTLTLVFDDNVPPGVPRIDSPTPGGNPTIVGSAGGRTLTVDFTANLAAGDTADRCELEVYADGATSDEDPEKAQPVTGQRIATTGAVTPTARGPLNAFSVTQTGLPTRTRMLYRLRVRNQKGGWGRWTPLDEGYIQTAFIPGIPIDVRLTSDPSRPIVSATLNSADPADGVTGLTGTFVKRLSDGTTVNLWPNLDVQQIAYVAGALRAEVPWGGIGLNDGDIVYLRVSLLNRDGVASPLSPEVRVTMRTATGPTFDPPDATSKLTSRTGPVTITDPIEFDGYRYRLYRNDVLIYTSPIIGSGPDTTADIALPAGLLNWGDTFGIEAETRPTNTTTFGPTSPRATLYIDTLPSTSLTASDGDGFTGPVVPTTDIVWTIPFLDPDKERYGDRPVARLLEVRHAATPQGSGALVDQRLAIDALKPIVDDEHAGYQLSPLTIADGIEPSGPGSADISVSVASDQPTDYSGDSVKVTFAGMTDDGGVYLPEFDPPLDLRGFASHAFQTIWRKLSSEANLDHIAIGLEDTGALFVEWTVYDPAGDATGAWAARFPALGFDPSYLDEGFDWSAVKYAYVWAYVTGSFSADLLLRDWRVGFQVLDSDPPDATYGIEFEESYDARAMYRDDADAIVTTQLADAASISDTNVKVDSVVDLVPGQLLTVGADDDRFQETRTIAAVGTSGSGGTGVDLTEELFYAHADDDPVRVLPWGPRTPWRTTKSSAPPVVEAASPADGAVINDPTPVLEHTFDSPGGKEQALRTVRLRKPIEGYLNAVRASGATHHFRLSERTGDFVDIIGGLTGSLTGTATRGVDGGLEPGDDDRALLLGGGHVALGDVLDLDTAPWSIAFLFTAGAVDAYRWLLDKSATSPDRGYQLYQQPDGSFVFLLAQAGSTAFVMAPAGSLVTGSDIRHGVITHDGATLSLYLDGQLADDTTTALVPTATTVPLLLGTNGATTNPWTGMVDELTFWVGTALTPEQVAAMQAAIPVTPVDVVVYERDVADADTATVFGYFVLEDDTDYSWDLTAYDTEGLPGSTEPRFFRTDFTVPDPVADLVGTSDPASGTIVLTWTASLDPYLAFYVVRWRHRDGSFRRVDLGPREVDDAREPLVEPTFTFRGGRLGANVFHVSVHNGVQESEPTEVEVERRAARPGAWMLTVDDDRGLAWPFDPSDVSRTPTSTVETFGPPGRPFPVHLHWGLSGRSVSMRLRYLPEEVALAGGITALLGSGAAIYVAAPPGYDWDVMRARVVGVGPESPQPNAFVDLSVQLDEIAPEAPA